MPRISYRTKLRLRAAGKVLLILAAILLVLLTLFFLYMQRFLVYTADGVRLTVCGLKDDFTCQRRNQSALPRQSEFICKIRPDIGDRFDLQDAVISHR